jgi:hypothetical protein
VLLFHFGHVVLSILKTGRPGIQMLHFAVRLDTQIWIYTGISDAYNYFSWEAEGDGSVHCGAKSQGCCAEYLVLNLQHWNELLAMESRFA